MKVAEAFYRITAVVMLGMSLLSGCSVGRDYRSEDLADEAEYKFRRDTAVTEKERRHYEIILDSQYGGTTRWYPLYNPWPEGFFNSPVYTPAANGLGGGRTDIHLEIPEKEPVSPFPAVPAFPEYLPPEEAGGTR